MSKLKILIIKNEKLIILTEFITLLTMISIAPLIKNQLITGTIVNSILFVSIATMGKRAAISISIIPSFIALFSGILLPIMIPIIPFIIMGNILLVIIFDLLNKNNYWKAIILASLIKFLFLFTTSYLIFNIILEKEIARKILFTMGPIQFITAVSGGILAFLIIKIFKKGPTL